MLERRSSSDNSDGGEQQAGWQWLMQNSLSFCSCVCKGGYWLGKWTDEMQSEKGKANLRQWQLRINRAQLGNNTPLLWKSCSSLGTPWREHCLPKHHKEHSYSIPNLLCSLVISISAGGEFKKQIFFIFALSQRVILCTQKWQTQQNSSLTRLYQALPLHLHYSA